MAEKLVGAAVNRSITWQSCESDYRAVNATFRDDFRGMKSQATSLNYWTLKRPSLKSSSVSSLEFAPLAWEALNEPADPPCSEIMLHHMKLFSEVLEHNSAQFNDLKPTFTADHCGSLNERKQLLYNTPLFLLLLPSSLFFFYYFSSSSSSSFAAASSSSSSFSSVVRRGCGALAQLAGGAGECPL